MRVRGRYLVLAWTAVFLAAVGAIVFRTRSGFLMQRRVADLNGHIQALEGTRGDVEAGIAMLKSRPVLAPKVAKFGLRFASDTEFHLLPVPITH
jgi:hypothetical protein